MFAENRKISLRQLQVLLLLDCFGTVVLFLPAELAQMSGRGCWIAALIGGLVFSAVSLLLTKVGSKMPEGTAVEWFRFCFGSFLGNAALFGLALHLLFSGLVELRLFSEVVCRAMLPNTPVWVISLVILAVSGALAAQGTECRGRAAEILFFVVAIPLVIILLAVSVSSEYGRVLPLELPSFDGIRNGIAAMSVVFQGLLFLYFIFPDLRKPAMAKGAVVKSAFVTTLVVTAIVFLCLAVYGENVLAEKLLPALQMMERVSFTGVFLTRQDVLLLWFWMASVCIFLSGILFYSSLLEVRMWKQPETKRKTWLWICLMAVFAASFLPDDLSAAYYLRMRLAPWFNLVYLVILPILLLLIAKRKGGERNA
ncbi:MAG: endospore germination permease [Anaerotignum sp.]|nr:endospore germination permease [Anaerotignum sp.]